MSQLLSINIITELPIWLSVFCVLLGAIYAFLLYRKEEKFNEIAPWLIKLMAGFRFLLVTLLAFLLLSPFIKTLFNKVEKPVIIIAQDNSASILLNKDSVFYQNEYLQRIATLKTSLDIIRIGTSGSLQADIPVDSFLMSEYTLDINGMPLTAGKYTLWTVPNDSTWHVIFNSKQYSWGVNSQMQPMWDPNYDVVNVEVPVQKLTNYVEQFTIGFDNSTDKLFLTMAWDDVKIAVPLNYNNF